MPPKPLIGTSIKAKMDRQKVTDDVPHLANKTIGQFLHRRGNLAIDIDQRPAQRRDRFHHHVQAG